MGTNPVELAGDSVLAVTTAIPEFPSRTDSSGSCSLVGRIAGVSPTVPSYPAGVPGDTVQPAPKPVSPHLQCLPLLPRDGPASDLTVTDTDHK